MKNLIFTLFLLFLTFTLINCDLFKPADDDFFKKIDAEIAYANAPWVPLEIWNGGLGTSSPDQGSHPKVVKKGYSFTHRFQPARDYPVVEGWQAWYEGQEPFATWKPGANEDNPPEETGEDMVKFVPANNAATELEIFVYIMPPSGNLIIGPLGAHLIEQSIRVMADSRWGTVFADSMLQRKPGFSFTVEFAASGAWDFLGWRAYAYDGQNADNLTPEALREELSAEDVEIVVTGLGRATVTVYTGEQVLLVPLCVTPVRVDYTNPPNGSPMAYAFNQNITIMFSTRLDEDTVKFGEEFIRITGQTGAAPTDITERYTLSYNDEAQTVTITPKPEDLLTVDTTITVTLDTGVKGKYGNNLAIPYSFNFSVSTEGVVVKNAYKATEVWALHDPAQYASGFFSQWANYERDRRIRKNTSGKYEVTLYFGVQAEGDIDNGIEHDIEIAEIHYAFLTHDEVSGALGQPVTAGKGAYEISENTETTGAGQAYKVANPTAGKYYRAVYTWDNPVQGIIRLAVLPSGGTVEKESWETVVAESRGFITVAFDNLAPGGTETAGFGGYATQSVEDGAIVYNYNESQSTMKVNLNFRNIRDNYDEGIGAVNGNLNASGGKPRTMDPQSDVEWQWRIVTGATQYPANNNTWLNLLDINNDPVYVISEVLDGTKVPDENVAREVQIRYRDTLGWESGWQNVGRIRYYNAPPLGTDGTWTAVYNGANNINVTWERPANATRTEVLIDGVSVYDGTGTSYTISGVPSFSAANPTGSGSRVRNGNASDVRGYVVSLRAYNAYHNGSAVEFNVYNSFKPNANFTNANTVFIRQDSIPENFTAAGIVNYVLTDNITLESWTPQNISSRNFYGNAYAVTITDFDLEYTGADYGYFAIVGTDVVIRDVTLVYDKSGNNTPLLNSTTQAVTIETDNKKFFGYQEEVLGNSGAVVYRDVWGTCFGGIAGTVEGNAQFINVLVKGAVNITHAGDSILNIGGVAGYMSHQAAIVNAYGGLSLVVEKTGTSTDVIVNDSFVGGIVGDITIGGSREHRAIDSVTITANVNHTHYGGRMYLGGAAGRTRASVTFHNIEYTGIITAEKNGHVETGDFLPVDNIVCALGGITGYALNGNYSECEVSGTIKTRGSFSTRGAVYVGGIWGYYGARAGYVVQASNCHANGIINFMGGGGPGYVGGVMGYSIGSDASVYVNNCWYEGGSIISESLAEIYAGGFSGRTRSNVTLDNCYSSASIVSVAGNSYTYAGGFTGSLSYAEISNCYSLSDVYVNGTGFRTFAGGFVGEIYGNSTVSSCYAAGDVTSISSIANTENYFGTGGFLGGSSYPGNNLNNVYALGTVIAEKISGTGATNVGGIAGYLYGNDTIERCFFGGTVTAIRASNNYAVNAGGIAGNITPNTAGQNSTITNCVVIGASVTAKAGSSRNVGRIWGNGTNVGGGNYAFSGMQLLTAAASDDPVTGGPIIESDEDSKDGKDTFLEFFDQIFWRNLPVVNSVLGFNTIFWDFSTVYQRGYPILHNLDGQENWSKWWSFALGPGSVSINDDNLSQTVTVTLSPLATGAVTLNTSALPAGVSATVADTTITVTGERPTRGGTPITGNYIVGVTQGNDTQNLIVAVNLTADQSIFAIGKGTSTSTYMPFNIFYYQSWAQTMYYADEILKTDGGFIKEISYFTDFAYNLGNMEVRVYMANTSKTTVTPWLPAEDFELVFAGTIFSPQGKNEIPIELDTPFDYDGGNLVILTHRVRTTSINDYQRFIHTTGSVGGRSRYYYDRNSSLGNILVPPYEGTASSAFPNIRLKFVEE